MAMWGPRNIILICAFGFSFLKVEGDQGIADKFIEKGVSQALSPLTEVSHQLQTLLREVESKKTKVNQQKDEILSKVSKLPKKCQSEDLLRHVTNLQSWDFDSCVNFTDDANNAADIVWETGLLTKNLTGIAGQIGSNMLNCPTWSAPETAKCYSEYLQTLKSAVAEFKNASLPLVKEGSHVTRQLRVDFDNCIGIPITSKGAIERLMDNC